jgi:hypothetical protein
MRSSLAPDCHSSWLASGRTYLTVPLQAHASPLPPWRSGCGSFSPSRQHISIDSEQGRSYRAHRLRFLLLEALGCMESTRSGHASNGGVKLGIGVRSGGVRLCQNCARTIDKHRHLSVAVGRWRSAEVVQSQQMVPDRDPWSRTWASIQLPVGVVERDRGGKQRGAAGGLTSPRTT